MDLAFEEAGTPAFALGFDLIKSAFLGILDSGQGAVVGPAQGGRKPLSFKDLQGFTEFITGQVMNSVPTFGRHGPERWLPIGKCLIKEPDIAQCSDRETVAVALHHACGQSFQDLLAIFGAAFAPLDGFHDFPADGPVGKDHLAVDGTRNSRPRLVQNGGNPFEQGLRDRKIDAAGCGGGGSGLLRHWSILAEKVCPCEVVLYGYFWNLVTWRWFSF